MHITYLIESTVALTMGFPLTSLQKCGRRHSCCAPGRVDSRTHIHSWQQIAIFRTGRVAGALTHTGQHAAAHNAPGQVDSRTRVHTGQHIMHLAKWTIAPALILGSTLLHTTHLAMLTVTH